MAAFTAGAFLCMMASLRRIARGSKRDHRRAGTADGRGARRDLPRTTDHRFGDLGGVLILGAGAIATIAGQLRIREPDL
jgi:hypothetical protein